MAEIQNLVPDTSGDGAAGNADVVIHAALGTPYERFLATLPDGAKGDLIDGTLHIDMSTSSLHEDLNVLLAAVMRIYADHRGLGKILGSRTTMKVDDENGYQPDVLFIRQDRLSILKAHDVDAPVDLAVEIVSKWSGKRDRETKLEGYQRVGVPEYWLIDPIRGEARFYRLEGEPYQSGGTYRAVSLTDGIYESAALPGFRLDPAVLFADPLPSAYGLLRDLLGDAA